MIPVQGERCAPELEGCLRPLVEAGWDDEDILLWMVSPNAALGRSTRCASPSKARTIMYRVHEPDHPAGAVHESILHDREAGELVAPEWEGAIRSVTCAR